MRNGIIITIVAAISLGVIALWGDKGISVMEADTCMVDEWDKEVEEYRKEYINMWEDRCMEYGEYSMPFNVKVYGERPKGGHPLYISMHGGGNVPAQVNNQQWMNQINLYKPTVGVYIAPRAAVDDWNMWFRPHIDTLFQMLIRSAVAELDINPDKVYLLGYSAGGDGAYRMAPRLADHWAAASMMAGHPGEASPVNLRNIGFMVWMGENDSAYNRNSLAIEYGKRMDSLQSADEDGYVHQTNIVKGCGHWMNRVDTAAIVWMSNFERNPYPKSVVWRQESSNLRDNFYYLEVPIEEAAEGKELRVEYDGNHFNILKSDYSEVTIYMNDKMVDLQRAVRIDYNGKELFNSRVPRSEEIIKESIKRRMDESYIFCSKVKIKL